MSCITEGKLREAIYELLESKWREDDGYRYYPREYNEGFVEPCFFILCELEKEDFVNVSTVSKRYAITLQYFTEGRSEEDFTDKVDGIRELLLSNGKTSRRFYLHVDDRYLAVTEFGYNFDGSWLDIPEVTFTLEFYDSYAKPDVSETMEEMRIRGKFKNGEMMEEISIEVTEE